MFLETKNLEEKKVFDLVSDDFRYAKALDSFGIDFFHHYNSKPTLAAFGDSAIFFFS